MPVKSSFLVVPIKPSYWLITYSILLHLGIFLSLYYIALPNGVSIGAQCLVVLHAIYFVFNYKFVGSNKCVSAVVYQEESWFIKVGLKIKPVKLKQATTWNWLVVLNFDDEIREQKYTVMILPDSAELNVVRRLKVIVIHGKH